MARALAGGAVGNRTKSISIKGGVFRLNEGGKEIAAIEERYLDVVIVNAAPDVSRVFYAKAYDGEVSAPDCWSQDGKTPSSEASNPQHNKCDGCQQNIAGSGQNNSRACRFQQHIAVVLANDMEGAVLKLTVPAKSVFGKEEGDNRALQAYARHLGAQNIDPSEVITRMKFDTKSEAPKLFFKAMRWLTDDEFPTIQEQGKTDTALKAITMSFSKMDSVAAPAPLKLEGKRPTAAPLGEMFDKDEAEAIAAEKAKIKKAKPAPLPAEEEEEPVVRKEEKKPNAVPKAKADLSAMVDDWDEAE
jgi:hypothetical protein